MLHPDLSGQQLGRYILGKRIGSGGMSVVYEALQTTVKRKVAVKILPGYMAAHTIHQQRFEREVELAARLEHPNIMPVYDFGTEQEMSFIVMRLLKGGNLQERIERFGRPPFRRGLRIIWQVASGLLYAHSHKIIHRDLKASNVLFDNHQNAYLADFGLARALAGKNNITDTGQIIGTPSYMAPEQWSGDQVNIQADIYALGVLSYYIFTGQLPFEGSSPYILMHKHINEMPQSITTLQTDLPADLDIIIQTAMAKQPENRFSDIQQFVQALRQTVTGQRSTGTGYLPGLDESVFDSARQLPIRNPQVLEETLIPQSRKLRSRPAPDYTEQMQSLLTIIHNAEASPRERLKAVRSLSLPDDPRPGIGCREDGLPDIDWVEIPGGKFIYQDDQTVNLPDFYIARYPITYRQFQSFVDASDGYFNQAWWTDVPEHSGQPAEQKWAIDNHPRQHISWFEAVAFCQWLNGYPEIFPFEIDAYTDQQGWSVRLPADREWEKAARGTDGYLYPWGNEYISGYANVDETSSRTGPHFLRQTTPVGMYPFAASPYGVMDMSGNVWEWCLTTYESLDNHMRMENTPRIVRGGAWDESIHNARTTFRHYLGAVNRSYGGFRVVFACPPA